MFRSTFYLQGRHGTFTVACLKKWNDRNYHRCGRPTCIDMLLGEGRGQADAGSLLHVCGVEPINIFPQERAADAAAVVAVKPVEPCGDLNSTMVSNSLEKSFPDFGM